MARLPEQEKQEIIRFFESDKPLPDKYRFLLFDEKREVELVWNGKTHEVCNVVLPFHFWMVNVWLSCSLLALIAWWLDIKTADLDIKLDRLAMFLVLTPPIATGLPFGPLLALLAVWQFRTRRIQRYTPE